MGFPEDRLNLCVPRSVLVTNNYIIVKLKQGVGMIIYATKQTFERYKLKYPSELTPPLDTVVQSIIGKESDDELLQWGAKLFYFDKRKCIQLVNFASKFTLFLCDIKVADLENIGDILAGYLLTLYKNDDKMCECLKRLFSQAPVCCFEKLTNKSIISTLNHTQSDFAMDGYLFYDYIENGILRTVEINRRVNFDWIFTKKVEGKTEYFMPGEKFRELVLSRYNS